MHLPPIRTDVRARAAQVGAWVWRASGQPGMRVVTVVGALEIEQLHLQIVAGPEQRAVEAFAPDGADQAFNDGMGERRVRHGLDFCTSRIRRFRCHCWNRYNGSWSELI